VFTALADLVKVALANGDAQTAQRLATDLQLGI
jgi:hypothetical protein